MRRFAPFAVVGLLLGSAYPLLRAQEESASSGALVFDTPAEPPEWDFRIVSGQFRGPEDLDKLQALLAEMGADGYDYAGPMGDGAVFKRLKR